MGHSSSPSEKAALSVRRATRSGASATKNVVMMDLALLSAEIANGMYKKPIEAIVKEYRYDPLPDEVRADHRVVEARGTIARRCN
jgi:hypothetical protein